ncbi:protein of unknown function (plasmid) [Streptantibioticus cattleyicolor NRRL 8057 = DSM 46488]|nr:protein of unknown function [Streptantibioticus cattleyicolor NRRL 8057 = DSM 46488]
MVSSNAALCMLAMPNAASGFIRCHARSHAGSCGLYDSLYRIAISSCGWIPAWSAYLTTCLAKRDGSWLPAAMPLGVGAGVPGADADGDADAPVRSAPGPLPWPFPWPPCVTAHPATIATPATASHHRDFRVCATTFLRPPAAGHDSLKDTAGGGPGVRGGGGLWQSRHGAGADEGRGAEEGSGRSWGGGGSCAAAGGRRRWQGDVGGGGRRAPPGGAIHPYVRCRENRTSDSIWM